MEELLKHFRVMETTEEHRGYFYNVSEAVIIVILGSFCGLKSIHEIHGWATSDRDREFLSEEAGINRIPSYYWLSKLLEVVFSNEKYQVFRTIFSQYKANFEAILNVLTKNLTP